MLAKLKMIDSFGQQIELFEKYVRQLYDGETELTILEAGCGRRWPLDLNDIKYRLIGVDLDENALMSRVNDRKDLDEAIVADLHDLDLGDRKVDVVYNSFVLEHVEDADRVLENLNNMLKPNGLLILRLPDRNTVFGFTTRLTPFWFHVFYKKYVQGFKDAGKPGFGPYPTHYNKVVSRTGIRHFCESHGYTIAEEYGSCLYLQENNLESKLVRVFAVLLSAVSLGRLPWKHDNLTYVLRKPTSSSRAV